MTDRLRFGGCLHWFVGRGQYGEGLKSVKKKTLSPVTIKKYIDYLEDAFVLTGARRFDIKGKKYINTPLKYYFSDSGLRNALLNFRQIEETHSLENIVFNELIMRGYNVDVGLIEQAERNKKGEYSRNRLEIDFVCNQGSERYYIQVAYSLPTPEKNIKRSGPCFCFATASRES